MLEALWNNRIEVVAMILFAVGFVTLLLDPNLIKKIIGVILSYTREDTLG